MKKAFVLFGLIIALHGYGQTTENTIVEQYNSYWSAHPIEIAHLKTDKNSYLTGEYLFYNINLFNSSFQPTHEWSEMVYLHIKKADNSYEKTYSIQNVNGTISGSIRLTRELTSGQYEVTAYTNYMRNFGISDLRHTLAICITNTQINDTYACDLVKQQKVILSDDKPGLTIRDFQGRMVLEISPENDQKNYFLVSENLTSIQFIAKVNPSKNNKIVLPAKNLKSQFQKLILIDDNLQVVAAKAFYLPIEQYSKGLFLTVNDEVKAKSESSISINQSANTLTHLGLTKSAFDDTLSLFKRLYQIAFNLPNGMTERPYEELVSSKFLDQISGYTADKWEEILQSNGTNVEDVINPDFFTTVFGRVSPKDDDLLTDALIVEGHLFMSETDVAARVKEDGSFRLPLLVFENEDYLHLKIYDKDSNDVSENYTLTFDPQPWNGTKVTSAKTTIPDTMTANQADYFKLMRVLSKYSIEDNQNCDYFWGRFPFDKTIAFDDFQGLANLEEFIKEVVYPINLGKKNNKQHIRLHHPETRSTYEHPPLMIIDNKIISDSREFFDIPLNEFKNMHLLESNKTIPTYKYGAVVVSTKTGKYKCYDFNQNDKSLAIYGDYHEENPANLRYGFRQNLLLNSYSKSQDIKFQSGYELGTYILTAESINSDGRYYRLKKVIKVSK